MEHRVVGQISKELNSCLWDAILVAKENEVYKAIAIIDFSGYEIKVEITDYSADVLFLKAGKTKEQQLLGEAIADKLIGFDDVETDAEMQQRMIDDYFEEKRERSRV